MMIEVILMVCLIMIQLMIGHLWHQIGWSYTKAILLMCLPLGIGLYLMQLFYYEYMYILTLLEYILIYVCFFM